MGAKVWKRNDSNQSQTKEENCDSVSGIPPSSSNRQPVPIVSTIHKAHRSKKFVNNTVYIHNLKTSVPATTGGNHEREAFSNTKQDSASTDKPTVLHHKPTAVRTKVLHEKQKEIAMMRQQLLQAEEELKQKKREVEAQEAARTAEQQKQQDELKRKRAQLSSSLQQAAAAAEMKAHVHTSTSSAPSSATSATTAVAKAGMPGMQPGPQASTSTSTTSMSAADAKEISRVLSSNSDYACLKVNFGASVSHVKSSYRKLAMALHPDKCKLEGAAEAFQKLHNSYMSLTRKLGA